MYLQNVKLGRGREVEVIWQFFVAFYIRGFIAACLTPLYTCPFLSPQPHRSYVRQRQHSEPFVPEVHPPPHPPRRDSGGGNTRGSSSAGHSPLQLPRTSPTIVPRGTVPSSRRNRTRSRSFHCTVSRGCNSDGEGQQRGPAFEYSDCFQSRKAQEVLCDMWERQELCDVVLVTEEREFQAHRVVLASGSPYFRAMFLTGLSESKQLRVELKTIPAFILEQILLYLYHSHFEVPVDFVQDAIPATDMLCISSLKEACAAYLQRQLSVTNCLGLYVFADTHSCMALREEALKVIQKHFSEVIFCDEFKQLSYEHLLSLVSMDCLSVSGEERVFEAIVAWVGQDKEKRKQHFKELLKQVQGGEGMREGGREGLMVFCAVYSVATFCRRDFLLRATVVC